MISAFLERANSTDLVSLQSIKDELGEEGFDEDAFLNQLIKEASALVENLCNRTFRRENITELLPGSGRTTMLVRERLPLKTISEIRYDGDSIDNTEYQVHNEDSGIIYRDFGWSRLEPVTMALDLTLVNQKAEKLWAVDYIGGYLLPDDDLFNITTISADSSGNTFDDSASGFPLLVPGEQFTISGFSDSTIDGTYTVSERTTSSITTVESIPATEAASSSITMTVRNLPYDIERLTKDMIKEMYTNRRHNPAITQETIGDSSQKYAENSATAGSLEKSPIVRRWRLRF